MFFLSSLMNLPLGGMIPPDSGSPDAPAAPRLEAEVDVAASGDPDQKPSKERDTPAG